MIEKGLVNSAKVFFGVESSYGIVGDKKTERSVKRLVYAKLSFEARMPLVAFAFCYQNVAVIYAT